MDERICLTKNIPTSSTVSTLVVVVVSEHERLVRVGHPPARIVNATQLPEVLNAPCDLL